MHFVGSLAQTRTEIPFQGLLLNYTPLPCSCPLWGSCFPWGCPVPVQPPHCRTSTGPCAPAVALSPWRISPGEQGPGPALPQSRESQQDKAQPEGSPAPCTGAEHVCSHLTRMLCTPQDSIPKALCREQNAKRSISVCRQRGKLSTRLKLLFSVT